MAFFRTQLEANRLDEGVVASPDVYLTTPDRLVELMAEWNDIGVTTFIAQIAAPFDDETANRLVSEIKPQIG